MYISITKQNLDATFSQASQDFVDYLKRRTEGKQGMFRAVF